MLQETGGPRPRTKGGAGLFERSHAERDRELSALFDHHYKPMCRLAFVILGDGAVAEEVVMEALLKTFSGWGRIRDPERGEAYLRRAVVNLCRSRIRRKALEARAAPASEPRSVWDDDARETNRLVWDAVRSLPERQRACVVLRYFEDLTEIQIADALQCSTGTVKSQLAKARAKLERALGPEIVEGGR
jgi:RNA polymerase sigma-70 factor (sigma-E family)